MVIVVPEPKRVANLGKHGIDMAEFEAVFSWDDYLVLPAHPSHTGREREMFLGLMHGRIVAAIVSPLGSEAVAIVSLRPASDRERTTYERRP